MQAKSTLITPRAFRFQVPACRIYSADGDNKAKIEVAVGPELQGILHGLSTQTCKENFVSFATAGLLEAILSVLLASST